MKWKIRPSVLCGNIEIPPSKSHTIRALLIATLAAGKSVINKPLLKGDGASAINAARSLGAFIEQSNDGLVVRGTGCDYNAGSDILDLGNSGTGTNLFASAAALGTRARRFDGDDSLRSRPFKALLDALSCLGASYKLQSPSGDIPFVINGPLRGGDAVVSGISSQFISSLLLTCPLIKNGNSRITVTDLHERPYVELTLWWLRRQGIQFECGPDLSTFKIPGDQHYSPFDITIPSDFSSSTFAAVGAAIAGSGVALTGLDFSDSQGDKDVFEVLRLMGAEVDLLGRDVIVSRGKDFCGREIDLNTMPDSLPALSVAACAARGETRFVNVGQARIKETDRIAVMCKELSNMGADVYELSDGLVVRGSSLKGTTVNGHNDHRVVMALSLAGMIASGETVIETAEAADVTYPGFVEDFRKIGANIQVSF